MIINSVANNASDNVTILIQNCIKYYDDLPWRKHFSSDINNYKLIYVLLRWLKGHLWFYEEKSTFF